MRGKMNTYSRLPKMEDVPQKKKRFLYVKLLLSLAAIFLFLAFQTALSTYNQIWLEEGRAYDTKWEHIVSHIVGKERNRLLKAGFDDDGMLVNFLDSIVQREYRQAIKKIPEGELERIDWYYWTFFIPNTYGNEEKIKKHVPSMLSNIVDQLKDIKQIKANSNIVRDLDYHMIVTYYAAYFFEMGPAYNDGFFKENRKLVLEAVFESVNSLDPSKILTYKKGPAQQIVFTALADAYHQFGNSVFTGNGCNREIAQQWLIISRKTHDVLLNDFPAAQPYLVNEEIQADYNNLKIFYEKNNSVLEHLIQNKCQI